MPRARGRCWRTGVQRSLGGDAGDMMGPLPPLEPSIPSERLQGLPPKLLGPQEESHTECGVPLPQLLREQIQLSERHASEPPQARQHPGKGCRRGRRGCAPALGVVLQQQNLD